MLKQQARLFHLLVLILDLLLVAAAFVLAHWIRSSWLPAVRPEAFPAGLYPLTDYLPLLPVALAIWGLTLVTTGRYHSQRTVPLVAEAAALIRASISAAVIFALVIFLFRLDAVLLEDDRFSRSWIFLFVALSALLLITEKLTLRMVSRYLRYRGLNYRTVLIVGTNEAACNLAEAIESHGYWGYKIMGFVHGDQEPADPELPQHIPILGSLDDLQQIIETTVIDDAFFALPRRDLGRLEDLFLRLHEQGIRSRFALNLLPHGSTRVEIEELDGMPLLSISPTPTSLPKLALKRLLDVGLAALLLLLGLPIAVVIALAIKATSRGGSVLFRQTRCGLNGRRFTLYKFRTMVEDAHGMRARLHHLNEMTGPAFKLRNDPRVTKLGRVLRKFSLDEVPQLWNVLRGDMSLVGPRPPIPEEVAQYSRWQRRRLSMKPGLTCLWQISGRNHIGYDKGIELDLEYIDSWSPSLDLKILLKTIPVVLTGRGAF